MLRRLWLVAACLAGSAMVFGQGTVSNSNGNGTVPPRAQGRAIPTPSTPNQELPGRSNPANAATGDAGANGQAMRPNSSQSGTPGTAAGNAPNGRDNTDNGIKRNDAGSNPVNGSSQNTTVNRSTFGVVQWFWLSLGFVVGLIVIGMLASRKRMREESDSRIASARGDYKRSDDQIRRAG